MNRKSATTFATLAALTIATFAPAVADDFAIDWWTIDGGGEMWTTGGDFPPIVPVVTIFAEARQHRGGGDGSAIRERLEDVRFRMVLDQFVQHRVDLIQLLVQRADELHAMANLCGMRGVASHLRGRAF